MGPDDSRSVSETPLWNLTDVTLADEDTNTILTYDANRAIQGNMTMQVTQPGGQICNISSVVTWWPTLQIMQVVQPNDQMLNQSKLCHLVIKYATHTSDN